MSASTQISEAQSAANRSNAQLSTGPRTGAGKSKVSLNTVETGLTGRNVFLPTDDAEKYQAPLNKYFAEFEPVGVQETGPVQSLIDTRWRLDRASGIEQSLFNVGLQRICEDRPEPTGATIEGHEFQIMEMYEKQLRNLHLQESRLRRSFEKELMLLNELRKQRKQREMAEFQRAAELRVLADHHKQPFDLAKNGFVFTKERFEELYARIPEPQKQNLLKRAL